MERGGGACVYSLVEMVGILGERGESILLILNYDKADIFCYCGHSGGFAKCLVE